MRFRSVIVTATIATVVSTPLAVAAQESVPTVDSIMADVLSMTTEAGIAVGDTGIFLNDATMINSTTADIGSDGGTSEANSDQQGAAMASNQ